MRDGLKDSNKPDLIISGSSHIQSCTFMNDAAPVWNSSSNIFWGLQSNGLQHNAITLELIHMTQQKIITVWNLVSYGNPVKG